MFLKLKNFIIYASLCNSRIHVITLYSGHVCVYYASMLRCWHLVWILFRTDYPCLGVGCHKRPPPKLETSMAGPLGGSGGRFGNGHHQSWRHRRCPPGGCCRYLRQRPPSVPIRDPRGAGAEGPEALTINIKNVVNGPSRGTRARDLGAQRLIRLGFPIFRKVQITIDLGGFETHRSSFKSKEMNPAILAPRILWLST
jgi:hypothetical protein